MENLNHTLEERGKRYGQFRDNARVAQELKKVFWSEPRDAGVPAYMREGIDQILSKLSRIAVGDMTYADNFTDIAGYATLIEKELTRMEKESFANPPGKDSTQGLTQGLIK